MNNTQLESTLKELRLLGMAVVESPEMKARRSRHDCPGC